jgi:hypothetical protein
MKMNQKMVERFRMAPFQSLTGMRYLTHPREWFAWRPVKTEAGWKWLRRVWYRDVLISYTELCHYSGFGHDKCKVKRIYYVEPNT